ncbi:hypothetical protein NDU88_001671 [Pleurodeles waltl]|uniref:Uncharacterized protein n=1 Tax=Pleurodeles waltl TaxID=8319 RepID=A0AAV7KSJ8_PLEWA|nr:hypothetical protein NDU88_001671 [Pleurodeles waltl]
MYPERTDSDINMLHIGDTGHSTPVETCASSRAVNLIACRLKLLPLDAKGRIQPCKIFIPGNPTPGSQMNEPAGAAQPEM